MDSALPLSVKVGPRAPGIVVDATFALSPMGLLVTMALSRFAQVWLPRGLYAVLDNDAHYRRFPQEMGGEGWLGDGDRENLLRDMAIELEPWRRAWLNGRLSSRVHWIADAQYESVLPDREANGLLPRFESCCAALDALPARGAGAAGFAGPLDDCARDVVALAAALQPETTYILTIAGPANRRPPLCQYLAHPKFRIVRWKGGSHWPEAAFAPALAPLVAHGGRGAAIVQIAAPIILALPDAWGGNDWDNDDSVDGGDEALGDIWRHAGILWRPLAAMEARA
jgi:hypothetical protein